MARKRQYDGRKELVVDFGTVTPKQQEFLDSKTFFTGYGGARGGGKTHIARLKAGGLALSYPGIRILMVRCHYPELEENLVRPMLKWLPAEIYTYNGSQHLMTFENGSTIKFGHWDGDQAENEYQGIEYDVIFIDEATQLSERAFRYLVTDIRGVNDFPKRMYVTCNPGGVGHRWVKRLFIDRDYINDPDNPEANENPDDYTFIFARVEDNPYLLESTPMYVQQLANLPEDLRAAYRYGDWDAIGGNYFKELSFSRHMMKRFKVPDFWPKYRSFDYGLDMFACLWWAVDEDGRNWCIRSFEKNNLIVQDAAKAAIDSTLPNEKVDITYAPPDMWNRQKDTGKTVAELFMLNGLGIVRSDNNRVQGHMVMKDMLADIPLRDPWVIKQFPEGQAPKSLPALMFFDCCKNVMTDMRDIQADEKNPNDCAKQPHDITHNVDAVRYYCVSRVLPAEKIKPKVVEEEDEEVEEYEQFMTGGEVTAQYMAY